MPRSRLRKQSANVNGPPFFRSAHSIDALESRRLFAYPVLADIAAVDVPVGKTVQIALMTDVAAGSQVTYAVRSGSRSVVATLQPTTNTFVRLDVAGYADPLVFELFNDIAPRTVRKFTGLVNSGFYNGLTFHRVINHFVIQGGDATATGSGGYEHPGTDEFNSGAIFSGTGQLAMGSGTKDDNGTQFFVTEGPQRLLDFNHTIFGQLVRGEATRQAISDVPVVDDTSYKPVSAVTITSARVISDTTDAVLQVTSLAAAGATTVRVTAATAEGSSIKSFTVTPQLDVINDPPILGDVPTAYYIGKNKTLNVQLSADDREGDAIHWAGQKIQTDGLADANVTDGRLTITPVSDFVGVIKLLIGVAPVGDTQSRGSLHFDADAPLYNVYDTQIVTVVVGGSPIFATGLETSVNPGATVNNLQVATFRSGDLTKSAADFNASIDWGDGTVTAGVVLATSRSGTYGVFGTKLFGSAATGVVPMSVNISDVSGATTTVDSAATFHEAAAFVGSVLTVYGTTGQDRIGISRKGAYYAVTVNGATRAMTAAYAAALSVFGLASRDRVSIAADVTLPAYIDAGDGNDIIYAGGGDSVINAGEGNDYVQCGDGMNRVAGGGGNDTLNGGLNRDRLFGGDGNDLLYGAPGRDILGGDDGDDTLVGGTSSDTLYGGDGDDVLNGSGGIDAINGGTGNDYARRDDDDEYAADVETLVL